MGKKLDLSKPIYELVTQYPELKDIMVELGFKEIANPAMLNSVGRLTTIPKGAKIPKISMMKVVTKLNWKGRCLLSCSKERKKRLLKQQSQRIIMGKCQKQIYHRNASVSSKAI